MGFGYDYLGPGGTISPPGGTLDIAQAIINSTRAAENIYGTSSFSPVANVRNIQSALNLLPSNLARLSVDGVIGSKTRTRIAEFQRVNGLSATGEMDNATLAKLNAQTSNSAFAGATATGGVSYKPSTGGSTNQATTPPPAPPPTSGISMTTAIILVLGVILVTSMD